MTFKHKLSCRLALMRDAFLLVSVAGLPLLTGCELARRPPTGPTATINRVFVVPDSLFLDPLQQAQFSAFGRTRGGDSVPVSVSWSATAGAITQGGAYTADTSLADVTVTATVSSPDTTVSGTARVRKRRLVAIVLRPASATISAGQAQQFAAVGVKNSGDTVPVNPQYAATGGTISSGGQYTAGATAGTYRVIASLAVNGGTLADTAPVTISAVPVATVTVSPGSASLSVGGSQQLGATAKDANGNTLTGRSISWSSNASGVASVNGSGLVTGVAAGTATITATSEGKSGTAAITVTAISTTHAGWYAAASGSSGGDGSITRPWDLRTAIAGASGRVRPGDTIWVRGGTYGGSFRTTVAGLAGAPVVIRAYPGERAIIDENGLAGSTDGFVVAAAYEIIWGLEFMNSNPTRNFNDTNHDDRSNTVVNNAPHTKFVNIVIHDGGNAFYAWPGQPDLEIYGAIIYNNGWDGTDRGHGHGLYLKNNTGPVVVRHSVLFNQFGLGFHGYSNLGDGGLTNIQIRDNVAFNNGTISSMSTSQNLLLGGEEPVIGGVVTGNFTYFAPGAGDVNVTVGYSGVTGSDVTVTGNYFVGGNQTFDMRTFQTGSVTANTFVGAGDMVDLTSATGLQWNGDLYYRDPNASAWQYKGSRYTLAGWKQTTGLGASDQAQGGTPGQTVAIVQPNLYEPGRANVIVYNWSGQGAVTVDLTGVLAVGDRYQVRSVQNLFGTPLATGTFGGGSISIPLTAVAPPVPIGMTSSPAPTTGPRFDVYLVTKVAN